jgi:HNH endonuclease
MDHFVAYHSVKTMGYPIPNGETLNFLSKKPLVRKAIDHMVWTIEGTPTRKQTAFKLVALYVARTVEEEGGAFVIDGEVVHRLSPAISLNSFAWFGEFKAQQANFSLGFNRVGAEFVSRLQAFLPKPPAPEQDEPFPEVELILRVREGQVSSLQATRRQRVQRLVDEKKEQAKRRSGGALRCEACLFDFFEAYGSVGEGFCEVHHLTPLSQHESTTETSLDDLAILCSNCHRMIHRAEPMLTVMELAKRLQERRIALAL